MFSKLLVRDRCYKKRISSSRKGWEGREGREWGDRKGMYDVYGCFEEKKRSSSSITNTVNSIFPNQTYLNGALADLERVISEMLIVF